MVDFALSSVACSIGVSRYTCLLTRFFETAIQPRLHASVVHIGLVQARPGQMFVKLEVIANTLGPQIPQSWRGGDVSHGSNRMVAPLVPLDTKEVISGMLLLANLLASTETKTVSGMALAGRVHKGKSNASAWCLSVCLSHSSRPDTQTDIQRSHPCGCGQHTFRTFCSRTVTLVLANL